MAYLVAPLHRELHDLDPELDVFHLTRQFPDFEPMVSNGFPLENYDNPADLILHGEVQQLMDISEAVTKAVDAEPGYPIKFEILSDEEYEDRLFGQAGI